MAKRGVLLINLGSPDSPKVADVRRYLREFLMDGRVIDSPWPVRFSLVNFLIIPRLVKQSAHAYSTIWTRVGSPLVVTSKNLRDKLSELVHVPVELAMRYQNPSIEEAIESLVYQGVDELLVVPLFPHYAMSSFETAAERAIEVAFEQAPHMKVKVAAPFYDRPDYIKALVASARPHLKCDHLLFSFHGLPERHLRKADPTGHHDLSKEECCDASNPAHKTCYRAHCYETVKAFAHEAGLTRGEYSVAFQSRLGREPWMQPYSDVEIARLAKSGVKHLAVICPAFVADCLETLEEIGMRGRNIFLGNGGKDFTLIPCLNEHPLWIKSLKAMVEEFAGPRPTPTSARQNELIPAL
jgi:protoporphyrin/coproporphyrin ferrochelatase